ncbi:zinc finger protein ubi-d4 A [Ischnura elegans]|uniref:zinc finger protein ubi-d4 A n=1 Tax=Ischnura elegans TaxID=197161 RepID=UPI001ED8A6E4|nr:zinc finger protein ubi-d4 A [Ischnura elegans]
MASYGIEVGNPAVLNKIQSFLNDSTYREVIENSSNYNTRLCVERRLRMPFLDSQTGVAQNHSNLFMSPRQRIPGLVEGQIYTYPSKRWRKKRRQYLMNFLQPRPRKEVDPEVDLHVISTVENPAAINEDSKDSTNVKEDAPKFVPQEAWFYDELDIQDVEGFDDPDPDSDYDYEETYSKRKKKRGGKVARGGGRGRKKANYDALTDAEKPFSCELCGARYKTRPGLTYHYTHSHKDRDDEEEGGGAASGGVSGGNTSAGGSPGASVSSVEGATGGGGSGGSATSGAGAPVTASTPTTPKSSRGGGDIAGSSGADHSASGTGTGGAAGSTRRGRHGSQASQQIPNSGSSGSSGGQGSNSSASGSEEAPPSEKKRRKGADGGSTGTANPVGSSASGTSGNLGEEKERAQPSPYCDFCLGDATENKKTGRPEELVSCSDCGRSGHPSCLQFTTNMIISVRKYRWQCIECKCCSICGMSDNDDQLLFCDDCDRGYHMYCLTPPLSSPPEGSWSCRLCISEFHKK